ncbi:hypothetical protein BJ165DRAFT_1614746 [Panaeolus papilionaceus]|nr:hypothetical protein BJ165DRAFT_1614746 [Panaeolus papilionaceus]
METPLSTEYKEIEVVGTVSVELIKYPKEIRTRQGVNNVILILGPTGAGKSTFLEALDSNHTLRISSNQLEGFTQAISVYMLINVNRNVHDEPIYLVDVPGFADTKISEMRIVSMLKDWMKAAELDNVFRVLYFTPINNPRLPGSHRQVLHTFQALTGVDTSQSITVVTTMWDCVCNENGRKRAESNFNQLQDDIWKRYVDRGTKIHKFHNTHESALSILDKAFDRISGPNFALVGMVDSRALHIRDTLFGSNIYNNLQQRVENLKIEISNLQSDLLESAEQDDIQLTSVLVPQLNKAQRLLATFEQEMHDFDLSPDTPPTHDIPQTPMLQSVQQPHQPVTAPTPNQPQTDLRRVGTFDRTLNSLKRLARKFHKHRED